MAGDKVAFDMISVNEAKDCNLDNYDYIGFASGIYMAKPHEKIVEFMEKHADVLKNKVVFAIFTSGSKSKKAIKKFSAQMKEKGITIAKAFRCKGYDTYGIFGLIGGINKDHPNKEDAKQLVDFLKF
jgi:flavodoxin